MTRAARFKQSLSRRNDGARNPHTKQLMIGLTIAVALALALVATFLVRVTGSTAEMAAAPSQEVVTPEPPVDVTRDNDPPGADPDALAVDEPASTPAPDEPTVADEPDENQELAPEPGSTPEPVIPSADDDVDPGDDEGADVPDEQIPDDEPVAEPTVEPEDFPDGSPLPDDGVDFPPPPALPPGFEPEGPPVPELPEEAAPEPLVIYSPVVPIPEPLPTPDPVDLDPLPGEIDGLSSSAFGCESRCITKALLSRNLQDTDVVVEIDTNVSTTNALWVIPAGPMFADGKLAHHGRAPRAVNQDANGSWSTTVTGLDYDTSYRAVLTAADDQGNVALVTTIFTTISEPVDELVAVGSPCVFGCITDAVVTPGPTFNRAHVVVETVDTETIDIAVSQSPPGSIAGNPIMNNEVVITGLTKDGDTYNANIFDLEANTTYYVLVTATDADGVRQHASGSFISMKEPPPPPPPVYSVVTWVDRFHIHQDGDTVGKGEISFHYGMEYPGDSVFDYRWRIPYQKLDEGETIAAGGYRSVQVEADEALPTVIVNAREADGTGSQCETEVGDPLFLGPTDSMFDVCPQETLSAAFLEGATVDWIDTLPSCDAWNVPGGNPKDRCFTLKSSPIPDDFVQFDALIVFRVFEP